MKIKRENLTKTIALIACACICLAFFGCSQNENAGTTTTGTNGTQPTELSASENPEATAAKTQLVTRIETETATNSEGAVVTRTVVVTEKVLQTEASKIKTTKKRTKPTTAKRPAKTEKKPTTTAKTENITGTLKLNKTSVTLTGSGATISGSKVTINKAGTYKLSGSLTDGSINVNVSKEEKVDLLLAGVNINSNGSSPLYVESADRVAIITQKGTNNTFSDNINGSSDTNACIYSKDDLTFKGEGTLTVRGNKNNGIHSNNDIKISGGIIDVYAIKNGIKGEDSVTIEGGNVKIDCKKDAVKVENEIEAHKGFIEIIGGVVNIKAGDDALQAPTAVKITVKTVTVSVVGKKVNCDGTVTGKELIN